jgi:hypothetical protein
MKAVCGQCNTVMTCKKNGVGVAPSHNPTWTYSGDKYVCEVCGNSVIMGFGTAQDNYPREAEVLINE